MHRKTVTIHEWQAPIQTSNLPVFHNDFAVSYDNEVFETPLLPL
jgi:hypothetical protein